MRLLKNDNTLYPEKRSISFPYAVYGGLGAIFVVVLYTWCSHRGWGRVLAYVFSINVGAFVFFLYDKLISPFSILRVPELVLHGWSLAGGSPGALLAQKIFRHKTMKPGFRFIQWAIFLVQILALGMYFYFRK